MTGAAFVEPRDVFRYHHCMTLARSDIALQMVIACHRLYERGYVTATDGNLSARLPNGNILITPASLNKGQVGESDLVEVTASGSAVTLSGTPSSELHMHLFVYGRRPDVNAVVHAHPPYATGFATARVPLPDALLPEVILELGSIPLADYATPSTDEVAASLAPFILNANAALLANHGVITFGTNIDEAYFRMEKIEHASHILFVARELGGGKSLTGAELSRLLATRSGEEPAFSVKSRSAADISEQTVKQLIRDVLGERLKSTNG